VPANEDEWRRILRHGVSVEEQEADHEARQKCHKHAPVNEIAK
jgi:hypothetical protein